MSHIPYIEDIPLDLAIRAHAGTSMVPDDRGRQEREGYSAALQADLEMLLRLLDTKEKVAKLTLPLADEFNRYRAGYRQRKIAVLESKARCVSTMITGPSNFNTRRAERAGNIADARVRKLIEFREHALAAIRKLLCPEDRPIMSGDYDALVRLQKKLEAAVALQARMKAANAAIRQNAKAGAGAQVEALVSLGFGEGAARRLIEPDEMRRVGFPDYSIANNNAEVRRIRKRLAAVEQAKSEPEVAVDGANARLEDCPAENRVRLFFPGKPAADVRAQLKASGFRWAPTIGCWSAYRGASALAAARRLAGLPDVQVGTAQAAIVVTSEAQFREVFGARDDGTRQLVANDPVPADEELRTEAADPAGKET